LYYSFNVFACCTATTAAVEGKMSKVLKKLLKKLVVGEAQEKLAVADAKLGNVIKVVYKSHKFAVKSPIVGGVVVGLLMLCVDEKVISNWEVSHVAFAF